MVAAFADCTIETAIEMVTSLFERSNIVIWA